MTGRFARSTPFAPAAVALAVFAAVGGAVLDDYGVAGDEDKQRFIGQTVVDYVLGDGPLPTRFDRYYGVAFEAPLILVERALGLTDTRAIYLSRHLLAHLFFLTGGFFCWLLTWRLFGDRWLALFALLLFLLHPRLYAHSFFNTKDLPFLAMFMIALYLVQRAFRRGTAATFALCGVGVGVLVNLRIMGAMLVAAVAALQALDLAQARGWPERRRALATTAAFLLAAAGTLYAISPYLWRDPLAIGDAVTTFARFPLRITTFFQGEWVRWPSIPAHYVPTWMAITTPPATLLLCLAGVAAVLGRGVARPRAALGNTEARFALLLIACLALPAAAVVALRSNLYHGWRHVYFLYAPLCLLAVYGLRWLLGAAGPTAAATTAARSPRLRGARLRRGGLLRRGIVVLAAAALAGMAAAGVRLHPYQQGYFNFLVDRRTPERLQTQYEVLHGRTEQREALQHLLDRFPDATLRLDYTSAGRLERNRLILPAAARRRIVIADKAGPPADFFSNMAFRNEPPFGPVLHARRIYHNTVLEVVAVDLALVDDAAADPYRAAYQATAAGEPLLRSQFDLYLDPRDGRTLTWVKEPCRPEDTVQQFLLRIIPAAVDDLPPRYRERGEALLDFSFARYGVRFDGRCLMRRSLPDYPLRAFEVGRWGESAMEARIDLRAAAPAVRLLWPENPYWRAHAAIAAGARAAPAARAAFDLYLDAAGTTLTYHKEPCVAADLRARFFLHLFPEDTAELAPDDRQAGFSNLEFDYDDRGALLGSACAALVPLPAWERGIARIRTGQFISGQGQLWRAEFPGRWAPGAGHLVEATIAAITAGDQGAPAARAAFDLYLELDDAGAVLIYHKQPCMPEDLGARFFLHLFPVDAAELPADHRPHGYYNRSFTWREHGAVLGSVCVALVPLPHYGRGLAHVRTGQYVSGQGQLWMAEFPGR